MRDFARFRIDDDDELVAASFACPACLRAVCSGTLQLSSDDPQVDCICLKCDQRWTVFLTGEQALRLALRPWIDDRGESALAIRFRVPGWWMIDL